MTSGTWLIIALVVVVAFVVWTTARVRMHAFLALILSAFLMGFLAKMPLNKLLDAITSGFGSTVSSIGIVIALGAAMGTILEKSGGAQAMAQSMLRLVGKARASLAMALTGYIVSIPVFCDSGFIILSPLNKALARQVRKSVVVMGIALSMGLYATHTLVPPTPGPIAAAGALGADLGLVIIYGLIAAFPAMLAGWWFAERYASRYAAAEDDGALAAPELAAAGEGRPAKRSEQQTLPSATKSFLPIVVPVVLILLKSIADLPSRPLGTGFWMALFDFIGHPVAALTIGTFLALWTVPKITADVWQKWLGEGIGTAGWIVLITAAGGALGSVIRQTELAGFVGSSLSQWHLGIFLPFLISAALKTAQGSSTVALITTSALIAPLLPALGFESASAKALVVLAIGAGSMVVSHANDSYFWVVTQLTGMDTPTGYRTQTLGTLVTGIVAIVTVFVMSLILV